VGGGSRGKPPPAMVDAECERRISGCIGRDILLRLGGRRLLSLKAPEDGCRSGLWAPPARSFEVWKKAIGVESSCG
jgi:hypothetical protein